MDEIYYFGQEWMRVKFEYFWPFLYGHYSIFVNIQHSEQFISLLLCYVGRYAFAGSPDIILC